MDLLLENVKLCFYDDKIIGHKELLLEFEGDSKSKYIHDIRLRLINNQKKKDIPFDVGYVVCLNDKFIGYVFISKRVNDEIFLEYSIVNEFRGKGYGKLVLSEVSEYLFSNYNIKSISLDIDPSNIASVMTAVSAHYIEDEEEYMKRDMNGKVLYRMDNYNYVNKRKK